MQFCLSLEGPFEIAFNASQKFQNIQAAIIAPDIRHRIHLSNNTLLFIYLDPESAGYSHMLDQTGRLASYRIWETWNDTSLSIMANTAQITKSNIDRILASFGMNHRYEKEIDPRIRKVLTAIKSKHDGQCSAHELEQITCLSRSRLQHLFVEQIGIPIRRFSLWLRMRNVISRIHSGDSITQAALAHGFSDSAHFSRIFREMFGIAPKLLFANNSRSSVKLLDEL